MHQTGADYMTLERQLFPRRMADALASLLSQRHGSAKRIAKTYKIDPSTAENLRKGHLSVPTLEKIVKVEGWALWAELGREMIGHGYPEHLQNIIEREANVQRDRERERDSVRRMEAVARDLVRLPDRSAA